jgi:hypothetical protein
MESDPFGKPRRRYGQCDVVHRYLKEEHLTAILLREQVKPLMSQQHKHYLHVRDMLESTTYRSLFFKTVLLDK